MQICTLLNIHTYEISDVIWTCHIKLCHVSHVSPMPHTVEIEIYYFMTTMIIIRWFHSRTHVEIRLTRIDALMNSNSPIGYSSVGIHVIFFILRLHGMVCDGVEQHQTDMTAVTHTRFNSSYGGRARRRRSQRRKMIPLSLYGVCVRWLVGCFVGWSVFMCVCMCVCVFVYVCSTGCARMRSGEKNYLEVVMDHNRVGGGSHPVHPAHTSTR